MHTALPKSIVFITGTFISNNCWDQWVDYFEQAGYDCVAPAWPYKEVTAEELRNRPAINPIALNTTATLTEHFAGVIRLLPQKPILIGHSLGGLIVQLLLQQDLASAGVAVHSFPPQGITRFRLSFIKAIWNMKLIFTSDRRTCLVSFRKWKYAIANGLNCEQQKELYYRYAIPESKKIIRDIFRCITPFNFKKHHVPLLLTSGSIDKLIPASLNYSNYEKYTSSNSITDYRNFKGQNHLVFGHPAWKQEADFILYWLQGLQ